MQICVCVYIYIYMYIFIYTYVPVPAPPPPPTQKKRGRWLVRSHRATFYRPQPPCLRGGWGGNHGPPPILHRGSCRSLFYLLSTSAPHPTGGRGLYGHTVPPSIDPTPNSHRGRGGWYCATLLTEHDQWGGAKEDWILFMRHPPHGEQQRCVLKDNREASGSNLFLGILNPGAN